MTEPKFSSSVHAAMLASVTDGKDGQTFKDVVQKTAYSREEEAALAHGLNDLISATGGPIATRALSHMFDLMQNAQHPETADAVLSNVDKLSRHRVSHAVDDRLSHCIKRHVEKTSNGALAYDGAAIPRLAASAENLATHDDNDIRFRALSTALKADSLIQTETGVSNAPAMDALITKVTGLTP